MKDMSVIYVIATCANAVAALGALIYSMINRRNIQEVHLSLNSRLDSLLAVTASSERAKGVLDGRAEREREPAKEVL